MLGPPHYKKSCNLLFKTADHIHLGANVHCTVHKGERVQRRSGRSLLIKHLIVVADST